MGNSFPQYRSLARSSNLWTCTRGRVAVVPVAAPAAKKRCIGVAREFKLRKTRKSLGGAVEQLTVNMKEANNLSALKKVIAVCTSAIGKSQQLVHTSSRLQLVSFSTRQLIQLLLHNHQLY